MCLGIRHRLHTVLTVLFLISTFSFGCSAGEDPLPEIVAKAIAHHGGNLYEASHISMTITSLSGGFNIEVTRDGGTFEYIVTNPATDTRPERKVRLTNERVTEWQDGMEITLDEEGERRARAFVDARVFFPLLPYTLKGGDIHFEDKGMDTWNGRELQRMKVTFAPGSSNDADDAYTFWFDPESGRVEQFGYDFDNGLRYRKATAFNRIGGVLFSDQENYAVDGGKIPVDTLSEDYVESEMRLLSTVTISNIEVEPL